MLILYNESIDLIHHCKFNSSLFREIWTKGRRQQNGWLEVLEAIQEAATAAACRRTARGNLVRQRVELHDHFQDAEQQASW